MVQSSCLKFCLARFSSWGLTSSKGLLSDERAVISGFIMLLLKRSRGNSLTFIAIHLHSLEWFCRGSIIRPTKALSNCSSFISLHLQLCTWTYQYLDPKTKWLVFSIFEYYEAGWSLCSNSYGPCCDDLSVLPFKERELTEDPCCQLHAPATAAIEDSHFTGTIPNGTFEAFKLQACRDVGYGRTQDTWAFLVILFSLGAGTPRLYYSAPAQSLASSRYAVVTTDHPYDADVVEFPDGTLVFNANIWMYHLSKK